MKTSHLEKIAIFWFRRDLRLTDNAGLYYALKSGYKVLPIFIFDTNILDKLEDKDDARVTFIYAQIAKLKATLEQMGSSLKVFNTNPLEAFKTLSTTYSIAEIYTNHDYERYAIERDLEVKKWLNSNGIAFYSYKDQCIFEKEEILSNTQTPYTIFTPYSRKWKEKLNDFYLKAYPVEKYTNAFLKIDKLPLFDFESLGFIKSEVKIPKEQVDLEIVKKYTENRNFPSIIGTSRLSIHLRFGTLSIRYLAKIALKNNETWLNELIWRDFYMNIIFHFPHVCEGKSFRKEYDRIEWRNNPEEFEKWCSGKTGYPIVDAGMRELKETGFMHNRVRMIVASFLTKHLLIDWRWGEAYFAKKLLDFDFAANNGGWQWASGSGCDAAPYFRVFNPRLQTEKFDKNLIYIKKWVPEINSFEYPNPIVDHDFARKRVLEVYKKALSPN
ncbi:MAG: deoxyribodipyrimidine photo-lyase [Bacteroidota bacterium]